MARSLIHLLASAIVIPLAANQDSPVPTATSEWQVHRSETFGYEIRYPPGFEVWLTGREGERDEGTIRIGLREFAAPAPVLDISVGSRMRTGLPAIPPTLDVVERRVVINGAGFRELTYRWQENDDVAFVELRHPRALMIFDAPAGTRDIHGTVWWSIMSTFRFLNGRG
jgi:hypothetical protein